MDEHFKIIRNGVGENARPTGLIRIKQLNLKEGRLQYQWRGSKGAAWIDVPYVDVNGKEVSPLHFMLPSGGKN